jgi:hypothetical protein
MQTIYKHEYETKLCDLTSEQANTVRANVRLLCDDGTLSASQKTSIALGILAELDQ